MTYFDDLIFYNILISIAYLINFQFSDLCQGKHEDLSNMKYRVRLVFDFRELFIQGMNFIFLRFTEALTTFGLVQINESRKFC